MADPIQTTPMNQTTPSTPVITPVQTPKTETAAATTVKLPVDNPLRLNTGIFSRGGVIGRKGFFLNGLALIAMMLIPAMIGGYGTTALEQGKKGIGILAVLLGTGMLIPLIVCAWFNAFKRMRDIRGTIADDTLWCVGTFLFLSIPYIGMLAVLAFLFMSGRITQTMVHTQSTLAAAGVTPIRPQAQPTTPATATTPTSTTPTSKAA